MGKLDPAKVSPDEAWMILADSDVDAAWALTQITKGGYFEDLSIIFMALDEMKIYGHDIHICYEQICGGDRELFHAMILDRSIKEKLNDYTTRNKRTNT